MSFVYVYENTAMKLVGIVLLLGIRENDAGVSLIKVHHKHIWKCHHETALYN
jgi:hypothetical protein